MTLAEVQARLDGKTGRRFWKNLDELAATPEFHDLMQEEFPRQHGAGEWVDPVSRRGFLKVMGASFALAGLAGCTKQPDEPIYPYVKQPEDLVLGKAMYFASAYPFSTGAIPVLVKSESFRPIKVNGNPEHPASGGAADTFTQSTLLDLYDPDRSQHVLFRGQTSSFSQFQDAFLEAVTALPGGQGLYFLSETVTSPTLAAQWKQVQAKYPQAKFVQWEPVNQDSSRAASKAAFGTYTDARYKLEDADIILALDADFLGGINQPGFLPLTAAWGERHMYEEGKKMNRLYAVESMPTTTGMRAEHRLGLRPSQIEGFADALVYGIAPSWLNEDQKKFFNVMLADLKKNSGRCVVIPGEQSPASVHAAAYALNTLLGAVGKTVVYTETVNPMPTEQTPEFKALIGDMKAGKVQWLVVLGANPVYSAPVDLGFAEAFNKIPVTVHLGSHVDETGSISTWHLNRAHYLESWSDARAYDGTLSIVQPMIDPLYGGKSSHEVLQTLLADPKASSYDVVVASAKTYMKGDFATSWRKALHDGWVADTAFAPKAGVPARVTAFPAGKPSTSGIEIAFRPDPTLYDGRFANIGWLQELPKPITNLSWDNAALMSINTMAQLKAEETNFIEIELNGRKVKAPVLMAPGHPDGVITIHLGFGRGVEAGRVAADVGFNAYSIRTSDALSVASGGSAKVIDGSYYDLCVTKVHNTEHRGAFAQHDLEKPEYDTQGTFSMAGHEAMERSIIRYATVEEAEKNPKFAEEGASGTLVNKVGYGPQGEDPRHGDPGWDSKKEVDLSFFPEAWKYDKVDPSSLKLQNAWGMSIDMNSCFGCNACVISCYAENNIPVVGREQVKVGRNMQWLRIDTYFEGDLNAPKAHFQPMACQHCENAGCEQVCPVGATVHSPEGLNLMVYNRCVGTRYCSNNCPYKVRRFNFLLYSDYDTESLKFMRNPDVSVRSRGVMEKCTYCVQRIMSAKITADKENREIRDGEIVTACQEACPTGSISFGNINDKNSKVAKRKAAERDYSVLGDLNYRPRTTYTAGVINPNPELA
ncbi:MAG: TAT-variant-translocated molybdopterin oxidoreductase [Edaphobacter sp.]|uniref:TAT-variant-translocated molybdopterin oxidoreductase n=1 Tax=Edaphobacter sp. TaxID=1934404 RepID=UPI00239BD75B|nr:TAT-variant-translocated molybdopterin oxidoreductase [Edaphobacter sp.]MDE1178684.1 TAT-variant-translocated molybdopterin oxidoreductase [Edaphobacter sp.]